MGAKIAFIGAIKGEGKEKVQNGSIRDLFKKTKPFSNSCYFME